MLDKIFGKKDKDEKDVPDLRKEEKKSDSDIGGRLKEMVSKATEKSKEGGDSKDDDEKKPIGKKIPRPIPRPRPKPMEKPPKLKTPDEKKKKPGRFAGLGGDFGRRFEDDDDQKTMIGAAVFGIILIVLVGAGYYFLVYSPYMDTLNTAKITKINEVNSYYKGPLSSDPQKTSLLAEIDAGTTTQQVLAVDVIGPATNAWRVYQSQEINIKKDPYGRVMITYAATGQKNLLMKASDAQTIVNEADASVLANMEIKTPDTVVIPVWITRLQAAGGLINVGDSVDIYLRTNTTEVTTNATNNTTNITTNITTTPSYSNESTPKISGATVIAILRAQSSGSVSASMSDSQSFATNYFSYNASQSQIAQKDVEQLLRAAASRNMNEAEINSLLNAYGWRLSDFERVSNLGELDAQYMVLLEVPREDAMFVIQNSELGNPLVLVVPTQRAPEWMIKELQSIYGTG